MLKRLFRELYLAHEIQQNSLIKKEISIYNRNISKRTRDHKSRDKWTDAGSYKIERVLEFFIIEHVATVEDTLNGITFHDQF